MNTRRYIKRHAHVNTYGSLKYVPFYLLVYKHVRLKNVDTAKVIQLPYTDAPF